MTTQMPNITACPLDPKEAAAWIFDWQDKLNELALGIGKGTVAIGKSFDPPLIMDTARKYLRAYLSECSENQENFFWKHWSKEAKEGRHFQLVSHDAIWDETKVSHLAQAVEAITGKKLTEDQEGTLAKFLETPPRNTAESFQNVKVELVDMLFFLLSLAQTLEFPKELWVADWSNAAIWNTRQSSNDSQYHSACVDYTIRAFAHLSAATEAGRTSHVHGEIEIAICELKKACALFFTMEEINAGYAEKLKINYERQIRGRKQIGDTLAETENKRI